MIIDVSRVEEAVLPFSFTAEAETLDLETANFRLSEPAVVEGKIERHIGSLRVAGTISGQSEIDCTRCLQPIKGPLSIEFDVDYLTGADLSTQSEVELQPDDLDTDELPDNQLDLMQLAREQILLSIPEQIHCSEDCKGLCEKCGENRNLVDCNCSQEETDPRWEALKSLKDSLN